MKIGITSLIPENIAPQNAKSLAIFDGDTKICDIDISKIQPKLGIKRYSFCALSDIHIQYETALEDFKRALTFVENNDVDFTCICGDLTSSGLDSELQTYKDTVEAYATKPVYAISGNHETSWGNYETSERISLYTGQPLYYSFKYGDDVFIMLGHYGAYHEGNGGWRSDEFISIEELQFLYETLEKNRNKRCFIFNHVYPYEDGVGDAGRLYNGRYWNTIDGGIGQAFIELLKHYKNVILLCGHTHLRFALQEIDRKANYSSEMGYRSVHISSNSVPRDLVDGSTSVVYAESEGYIVDVYDDCIILNGRDFIDNDKDGNIIPIATYKINTKLQKIEANTFVDSTGTIVIN